MYVQRVRLKQILLLSVALQRMSRRLRAKRGPAAPARRLWFLSALPLRCSGGPPRGGGSRTAPCGRCRIADRAAGRSWKLAKTSAARRHADHAICMYILRMGCTANIPCAWFAQARHASLTSTLLLWLQPSEVKQLPDVSGTAVSSPTCFIVGTNTSCTRHHT